VATATAKPTDLLASIKQGQELTLRGIDALIDATTKALEAAPLDTAAYREYLPDPKAVLSAGFGFADEIIARQKALVTKLVDLAAATK
jgi:hypothetical protein